MGNQNHPVPKNRYTPLVLVQPAINALSHFLGLKCHNVATFLSGQPNVFFFIKARFCRRDDLTLFHVPQFFSLHHGKNAGILSTDLRQQPSARFLTLLIRDIHFELNLLVNNDSNYFRIFGPLYRLKFIDFSALTYVSCIYRIRLSHTYSSLLLIL